MRKFVNLLKIKILLQNQKLTVEHCLMNTTYRKLLKLNLSESASVCMYIKSVTSFIKVLFIVTFEILYFTNFNTFLLYKTTVTTAHCLFVMMTLPIIDDIVVSSVCYICAELSSSAFQNQFIKVRIDAFFMLCNV